MCRSIFCGNLLKLKFPFVRLKYVIELQVIGFKVTTFFFSFPKNRMGFVRLPPGKLTPTINRMPKSMPGAPHRRAILQSTIVISGTRAKYYDDYSTSKRMGHCDYF